MLEDGPCPDDLLETDLWERFGWTPEELDEADMARVLPGVSAANLRDVLMRVRSYLETGGRIKLTERDLKVYGWARKVRAELEAKRG